MTLYIYILAYIISLLLCNNLFYALVEFYSILSLRVFRKKRKCIEHANVVYYNLMKSRILLRNEIALNSQKKKGKSQEKIKSLKYKIRVRRKINFLFIIKIEISKSFLRKWCHIFFILSFFSLFYTHLNKYYVFFKLFISSYME